MATVAVEPLLTSPIDCVRRTSGLTIKTDFPMSSFPEYQDPFLSSDDTMMDSPNGNPASKLVDNVKHEHDRHPSPQPTRVSYPYVPKVNGNGHKVLRSATVGYVAPEFKGRDDQMKQGQ